MDWKSLRRIVTENAANGRSRVLIDSGAAKLVAVEETGLAEIWGAKLSADRILDDVDRLADEDMVLEPEPGEVKVRWFTVAPEDDGRTMEEKEAFAVMGFGMIGASNARVETSRHPAMHKTDSLDFVILVKGEIDLTLDDGEPTRLKPGDVVVQRGTNHAWINPGNETALLVAILIKPE